MIEIMHVQAMTLRGILHRAKAMLSTVETASPAFAADQRALIKDLESWHSFLLKKMQEASPALTGHYAADSANGSDK